MAQAVLLFDSAAASATVRLADRQVGPRRRLRPVAHQDPEADELPRSMDEERKMASWHLVAENGSVYSAGAASRRFCDSCPAAARLPRSRPSALGGL